MGVRTAHGRAGVFPEVATCPKADRSSKKADQDPRPRRIGPSGENEKSRKYPSHGDPGTAPNEGSKPTKLGLVLATSHVGEDRL